MDTKIERNVTDQIAGKAFLFLGQTERVPLCVSKGSIGSWGSGRTLKS